MFEDQDQTEAPGAAHDPTCPACAGTGRRGPAGTALRASGKDGPQIVRSKGKRWTQEAEDIFLDSLGSSCNVLLSALSCGFSAAAVYARRRRDPDFAQRWDAARDQGVARLDMLLLKTAEDFLQGRATDPASPFAAMSVRDAIAILKLHRPAAEGLPAKYPGWRGRPRSLDEMRVSILAKFEAIERHEAGHGEA